MEQSEFNSWFEEVKKNAIEEFGYSENEANNFSEKNWEKFFNKNLKPNEAIHQYLKGLFNYGK